MNTEDQQLNKKTHMPIVTFDSSSGMEAHGG